MTRQLPINSSKFDQGTTRLSYKGSYEAVPYVYFADFNKKSTTVTKDPSWTSQFALKRRNKIRIKPLAYFHSRSEFSPLQGFYRQIKREMSYSFDTGLYTPHTWDENTRTGELSWHGNDPVYDASVSSVVSRANAKAVSKLLLGVKDSKFNGAQAFAEASQVHKMIAKATVTLSSTYHALRRGNLQLAGESLGLKIGKRAVTRYRKEYKGLKSNEDIDKMLSNGILAVQYGIRPLIADVIGASELYAQKRIEEVINHYRSGSTMSDRSFWSSDEFPELGLQRTGLLEVDASVSYGVTFGVDSPVTHALSQLGLTNPLNLAWELLPWSFVIDWFLPMGNYLSSLDATLGLSFRDGYKTTKVRSVELRILTMDKPPPSGDGYGYSASGIRSEVLRSFRREVLTDFPGPVFPHFKNPLSIEHAINGIALLAGFKKKVYFKQPSD